MRQSLQLTNSVILERKFKMTVQSKRKQKNRQVVCGGQTNGWKLHKKIPSRDMWNTNVRMGLKANLYRRMTQTVHQTKSLICKFYPIEKAHIIQKKCRRKPGRMAERSKAPDSRNSSVENSGTRVCAWVRIHSCQKTFWTRWGRAFSWQILSYWNVNSRWLQSKRKQKNRNIVWGW